MAPGFLTHLPGEHAIGRSGGNEPGTEIERPVRGLLDDLNVPATR